MAKDTKLDEKAFGKWVQGLTEYKRLARAIGTFHGARTVRAMWNKFSGMGGGTVTYGPKGKGDYETMLKDLLKYELQVVLSGHYYIGKLQQNARMKVFTSTFATKTLDPATYGVVATDSNFDKAVKYIVHTSNSLRSTADKAGAPVTRRGIKLALMNGALYDVRKESTLRDLHRRLVDQSTLKESRCMVQSAPYPSTGGAGFLLQTTFDLAQGLELPAYGNANWFNLACYLLGATIRSHGFTDGNGRVGRAAYAAAMLKGGIPFVALEAGAEKLIHGLDQVS
jgi:hypothetical protein